MTNDLNTLGDQLRLIDQEIMNLVLKRVQIARQVGISKYLSAGIISRPSIEDERITAIKQYAKTIGLNPHYAESLLYGLINESCKEQMIQLQQGKLLRENIMNVGNYGNESLIHTKHGDFKTFNLRPKLLSSDDKDYLFEMIYPVAQSAFGQGHSDKFSHDVRVHGLDHSEILVVQDQSGKVIAFRTWDVLGDFHKPIIYLAGMCVSLECQKLGLGSAMIEKAIDLVQKDYPDWGYVVLRTQNWAMQKSIAKIATRSGLYQKFGDTNIAEDIRDAAQIVATKNSDTYFEPAKLVSRRIYGMSLYGNTNNFQEGFEDFNPESGDAAYCVWRRS